MSSVKAKLAPYEIGNIVEGEEVGSGSYGIVRKVTLDGITRIAKRVHDIFLTNVRDSDKERTRIRFDQECIRLSELDHPNVVEFLGVQFDHAEHVSVLLMEYLHTDLENFLNPQEHPSIPLSVKLSILLDITSGLVYLHTQLKEPLVHRDLNAGNILLTADIRAKIADLGMSKILDYHPSSAAAHTACPGAQAYMPPEALQDRPDYGTALDIFSFGHLALYVALQEFPKVYELPSGDDSHVALMRSIKEGKLQLLRRKKWMDMLPDGNCLKTVIEKCLHDKPKSRPEIKELNSKLKTLSVKHPKSCSDVCSVWNDQAEREHFKHQMDELVRNNQAITRRLHDQNLELSVVNRELQKYKSILADMEMVLKNHKQNAIEEVNQWREQAEASASQVKQYAKEHESLVLRNEQLRQQLVQMSVSEQNNKILMDMLDKVMKEKDHLKKQAEGHAVEERAAYEQRLDEIGGDLRHTRELLHKHKVLLADAEKINQTRVQEAKIKAEIAIKEADKYYQESEKFRQSTEYWRHQAEVNQRNVQAKASQVKQYAKEVERVKEQIAKEKDHLKKQNDQLAKQNEQLKKKRKGSTDKLLAFPDPPPEEDSTSIGIEYAYQQARADVATAKATKAERRAKEAEKQARAVGLRHLGAESRAATMEKQLFETMVEVQRLNYENEQLRLWLNQLNPNSTTQPANVTWPLTEDSKTAGSGPFAHAQPLHASLPEEPSPQGEHNPSVATPTTGKPAPPAGGLHLQSTAIRPHSQRIAVSPLTPSSGHSTPTSGHSMDDHLLSGTTSKSSASQHTREKTNLGEPVEQSTGHSTHSERVIGAKDALQLHNQRRPISYPLNVPSSDISTNAATAGQLSRWPLHESQPQLGPNQSHPSNLPPRDSSEIISPTKGSPQPLPRQGVQRQMKEQLSPLNPPSQSGPPAINDTSSESEGDSQPGDDDEYGNQLQKGVDDDIHKQAAAVIKQVSGGRHQIKTDIQRPYDPNLIILCPMCMKKFRIGEIQKFKRHVNTCDGTDDDAGVGAIADDSDLV